MRIYLITLCILYFLSTNIALRCQVLTLRIFGGGGSFVLQGSTSGTTNFILERSIDLTNWTHYASIVSKTSSFRLVEGQTPPPPEPPRFFRLAAIRTDFAERKQRWDGLGWSDYRFRFYRACFCPPHVYLSALVTVRDGVVVAVEDVRSEGQPVAKPENFEVKTIEQMFALVDASVASSDLTVVDYHEVLGFPERIEIDWLASGFDDEETYRASDVVRLP